MKLNIKNKEQFKNTFDFPLLYLYSFVIFYCNVSQSSEEFDASFLQLSDSHSIDVSRFSKDAYVLPGVYQTMIYINNQFIKNTNVTIKSNEDKSTQPCLDQSIFKDVDFELDRLPSTFNSAINKKNHCIDITTLVPDSTVNFDSNESRLDIQVPQFYINNTARGTTNPDLWDEGVPSVSFSYNANGYNSSSYGKQYQSAYASLNTGINVGAWYFRQNGSINWSDENGSHYSSTNAYIQRDIPEWQGRVIVGQSNSKGQLFDTLPFTGIQFNTDDRMLPTSQRGYAPEVRGIAKTTAKVTIRQGEQVIYETTVSPGAFLINDLYPTGFGGNLNVTVLEADGSEQHFLVPYASIAQLLRPNSQRYSVIVGQYRNNSLLSNPSLLEATYQRGLMNSFTTYAGLQANQNYYSVQVGAAVGTFLGSFSADITQAHTTLGNQHRDQNGQSYQIKYSNIINSTGSSLSLAAYRFSTKGYMDYQTAMQTRDTILRGNSINDIYRSKNRFILSASQSLTEDWGQFYISGSLNDYWEKAGSYQQYQVGYNNQYKKLTWGISANRSQDENGSLQTNYTLDFSLPLGTDTTTNTAQFRMSLNRDTKGNERQQANVSGALGEEKKFNYALTASNTSNKNSTTGDVNVGYVTPVSSLNASYSAGKDYQSQSVGVSGSIIAHSEGITASPYTGNTYALVEAKGAEGASVSGYSGIEIDSNGYALVPNLNPYQINDIYIDPKGSSKNIEFTNTSHNVAPYYGAVVSIKFNTKYGIPLLIHSKKEGKALPFGATVFDDKENIIGSVGQGGQIYARVSQLDGVLLISWGENPNEQCQIDYTLTKDEAQENKLHRLTRSCQ